MNTIVLHPTTPLVNFVQCSTNGPTTAYQRWRVGSRSQCGDKVAVT
ncbi:MAG: hypothetical protein H6631_16680 [Anaerolineaceae bacterium]|nr:hypothetical protein [Anaerolineaceae bacterium]